MSNLQDIREALVQGDKLLAQQIIEGLQQGNAENANSAEILYLYALTQTNNTRIQTLLQAALREDNRHAGARQLLDRLSAARGPNGQTPSPQVISDIMDAQIREDLGKFPRPKVETQSTGNVYEMLWDCQFCGTKGNLGLTHRFCPNCGGPQNPDSRYFPSDAEKVAVHNHEYVGADVTCPACGELNGASAEFCGQCGSPLTEGAKAKTLTEQSRGDHESFAASSSRDVVKEQFDAEMERVGVTPSKSKRKGGLNTKVLAIIAVVIVAIGGLIAVLTAKVESELLVTGHEWERTIDIQEYQNFTERSWRDSRPSGDNVSIRVGSCTQEQRGSRQVPDGEECRTVRRDQGDGTYREDRVCETKYRNEPIYDDMCTWTGQRWQHDRTLEESGGLDDTPIWPNVSLNCEGQSRVGCERESSRSENYWVLYQDSENKNYRCDFAQNEWAAIPVESAWKAQVGRFVTTVDCDSLERK